METLALSNSGWFSLGTLRETTMEETFYAARNSADSGAENIGGTQDGIQSAVSPRFTGRRWA